MGGTSSRDVTKVLVTGRGVRKVSRRRVYYRPKPGPEGSRSESDSREGIFRMSESESSTYDLSSAGEGSDAEQFESGFHDATQFQAKVVHPYTARYRDELCLQVGEVVDVLSTDPKVSGNYSWWTGRVSGLIGVFPASCVRQCSASPSTPPPLVRCGSPHVSALTRLHAMDEYPQRIPMREIDKKGIVGRGGFGHVYRALWRGEEVALKMSRLITDDHFAAMEEVLAEAQRFACLKHRNICTLLGICVDYPEVGIVMQYARGGSMSKTVHSPNIQLPVAVALDWALQIAEGMHYLHHGIARPLVHRDLKSNNSEFVYILMHRVQQTTTQSVASHFLVSPYRKYGLTQCPNG